MLALLIPILALSIPIVAIAGNAAVKVARYRAMGATDDETRHRLELLEHEMLAVRQELADTQERLDFTERLLARGDRDARGDLPHSPV